MKTIEERAEQAAEGCYDTAVSLVICLSYKKGAKEQRKIDIDKAWQWIRNTFFSAGLYYVDDLEESFRKAMEKE